LSETELYTDVALMYFLLLMLLFLALVVVIPRFLAG
jgi:hypothetical protein